MLAPLHLDANMPRIKFGKHSISLPSSRLPRIIIGIALIFGGIFSFLPVLGIWMLPLGLLILSMDFPGLRRRRREWTVRYGPRFKRRFPRLATLVGFGVGKP
jgi:hypothetical protein